MNPSVLSAAGKVFRQTGFFSLGYATTQGEKTNFDSTVIVPVRVSSMGQIEVFNLFNCMNK